MNSPPDSTSQWSMSFTLFFRLNDLFNKLNNAALTHNLYLWYNLLLILYKEVAPLIDSENRKQYEDKMMEFIPAFIELKKAIDQSGKFNISASLYSDLQRFEISLRDIVNERGIYLKTMDKSEIDFSKMFGGD